MESSLDRSRSGETGSPRRRSPRGAIRLFGTVLAIMAMVAFGSRQLHPSAAASIGAVAYCVTSDGAPAGAGLHTALYTTGDVTLQLYDTGRTDFSGCGVFNYVPAGQSFFVAAWSDDGERAGISTWFRSDAMVVVPPFELNAQTSPHDEWMSVFQAQAYVHAE